METKRGDDGKIKKRGELKGKRANPRTGRQSVRSAVTSSCGARGGHSNQPRKCCFSLLRSLHNCPLLTLHTPITTASRTDKTHNRQTQVRRAALCMQRGVHAAGATQQAATPEEPIFIGCGCLKTTSVILTCVACYCLHRRNSCCPLWNVRSDVPQCVQQSCCIASTSAQFCPRRLSSKQRTKA
jgi:hypothetical protein